MPRFGVSACYYGRLGPGEPLMAVGAGQAALLEGLGAEPIGGGVEPRAFRGGEMPPSRRPTDHTESKAALLGLRRRAVPERGEQPVWTPVPVNGTEESKAILLRRVLTGGDLKTGE